MSRAEPIAAEHFQGDLAEFVRRPDAFRLAELPIEKINTCAQHRNDSNPVQQELNKSVANRGLINPLTVAILEREQTEVYIEFTNRVWQKDVRIANFVPYDEYGQEFAILVAGHSRLRACQAHAEAIGYEHGRYFEHARILSDVATVDDIVAWQTEENIHSSPPPQNTARALAESWFWLKSQEAIGGERVSQREFARRHRVGEKALRNALDYIKLPPDIRGLTEDGLLPYNVAVEIGRATSTIVQYVEAVEPESADELFETELLRLAMCYLRREQILTAVQEVRARVNGYRVVVDGESAKQPPLEDFMTLLEEPSPIEQARSQLEVELKDYKRRIQRGQIGLHNAIARLASIEEAGIDVEYQADLVEDAVELIEGEPVHLEQ